jgi:hypothetical protein
LDVDAGIHIAQLGGERQQQRFNYCNNIVVLPASIGFDELVKRIVAEGKKRVGVMCTSSKKFPKSFSVEIIKLKF